MHVYKCVYAFVHIYTRNTWYILFEPMLMRWRSTTIIYIHICIYMYIYVYIHLFMYTYLYIYIYTYISIYVYEYIIPDIYSSNPCWLGDGRLQSSLSVLYIYVYRCISLFIYIFTFINIYAYINTFKYIYTYISIDK
jgi:hypothetical protein